MAKQPAFFVADLNTRGELRAKTEYTYTGLEHISGADDLIAIFSANLWRTPETFESAIPAGRGGLMFRWLASAPTAGIGTLRYKTNLLSLSLLATGLDADADRITFMAFQQHQLRELHDTGYEPAFDLMAMTERPLVATINFQDPEDATVRNAAALVDRCFAASYFRYQQLT